jgi:ferric-dicitrate binding protein FerR (iron transport regulator)
MLVATFVIPQFGSLRMPGITRRYTTGVNQQGILTLGDGTRVTLFPQSTLWLNGFSKDHRIVSVDGKAYFEVAHATGAPFEVRSGAVTTRVLGTAFLVDHAVSGTRVRVAVAEGKVRISNAGRTHPDVMVTGGYVGAITDSSMTVTAVEDSLSRAEWLNGQLVFHHMPVGTVLRTLSRWYGYQFRYTDSTLSRQNVTVGLSVQSPALALATLEELLQVSLTITGDTVTLTPHAEGGEKGRSRIRSYDVWTPVREAGR